jgi:Periplasmic protease
MKEKNVKTICISGIMLLVLLLNNITVDANEEYNKQQNSNINLQESEPVLSEQSHALSKEQMYQDYDYMWNIISENYPYIGVAERVTGLEFSEVKMKYRNKIASIENDKEFFNLVEECLAQFGGCGHMMALNKDKYFNHMLISYQYKQNPTHEFLYNVMNNKKSKHFYQYDYKDTAKSNQLSKESNVVTNNNALTKESDVIYKKYMNNKVAYMKIKSFNNLESDKKEIQQFFHGMKGCNSLIIDIRGNTGGNAEYWRNYLVLPNLKEKVTYHETMLIRGEKSKKFVSLVCELQPISKLNITKYSNLNMNDIKMMDNFTINSYEYKKSKKPEFSGDIYLLVDNKVYSAAEGLAYFCKSTGWATIIGENTGGDGMLMNPMVCVLKNSGICFQFTAQLGLNSDGSSNEEVGTNPDIFCKSGNALKVCLKEIEKKNLSETK